jgi:hypothetical protein
VSALLGDAASPAVGVAAAIFSKGDAGETLALDELKERFKVAELGVVEYEETKASDPSK